MPFFIRAEMNEHISKSGENIHSSTSTSTHSVPTSVRKATTFLQDECLKEIVAASDDSFFTSNRSVITVLERMIHLIT